MKHRDRLMVKTSVLFDKSLLEEVDRYNPFQTRKDFLDHACRVYLQQLRRKDIDEQLAAACSEAEREDESVNKEWEGTTLETWG